MDFIRIKNLTNKYPQVDNYTSTLPNTATLFGLYNEKNKIDFELEDFQKEVYPIDDISTRYIFSVAIDTNDPNNPIDSIPLKRDGGDDTKLIFSDNFYKKDSNSQNIVIQYFCSSKYYDDLLEAQTESNPYFINFSFNPDYLIEIKLNPFIKLFNSQIEKEETSGIIVKYNNFIFSDNKFDVEKLLKYLDWLLTKPTLSEIDTDNVIPAVLLSDIVKGEFDRVTGKWDLTKTKPLFGTSGSSGSGGSSSSGNSGSNGSSGGNNNGGAYPPVGRAGTMYGEVVNVGGEDYVWMGTYDGGTPYWRPFRPNGNNSNGNTGNTGGGNTGNTGGGSPNGTKPTSPGLYIGEQIAGWIWTGQGGGWQPYGN